MGNFCRFKFHIKLMGDIKQKYECTFFKKFDDTIDRIITNICDDVIILLEMNKEPFLAVIAPTRWEHLTHL